MGENPSAARLAHIPVSCWRNPANLAEMLFMWSRLSGQHFLNNKKINFFYVTHNGIAVHKATWTWKMMGQNHSMHSSYGSQL